MTKADTARLLTFYRAGRAKGSFDTGIQMALRRLLASPTFVFRVEEDRTGKPGTLAARQRYRARVAAVVLPLEQHSRTMPCWIWRRRGQLRNPAVLEREVRRMIADPKADSFVRNFSGQWLHTRNLRTVTPNHDEFPDFDDTLRDAFQSEAELFFESIVRGDRNALDLLTADYTFVNERLAKHYGIPYVYGSQFRRVTLTNDARRGLLGKGGLLMVTSRADRTAPVLRGKWILENVLGTPPPPPLPIVPPLEGNSEEAPKTLRQRLEMHRASPACASCHKVMDPLGFALENFDAIGAWRTTRGRTATRCLGAAGRRHQGGRCRRASERSAGTIRCVRADADREADDLRARARAAALRHAGGQGHRPKSRASGLPVFGHHHGDRREPAVPDAARG